MPGGHEVPDRSLVVGTGGREVPHRPAREPAQGARRAVPEVVGRFEERQGALRVGERPVGVARQQRQPGAVDRHLHREAGERVVVGDDRRPSPVAGSDPSGASSQRSMACTSASTPRASPVAIRAPTRVMLSTGRSANSPSGSLLEPAAQRRLLAGPLHLRRRQLDETRGPFEVLAGQRVTDRLGAVAVLLVPGAGATVELADQLGLLVQQVGAQDVGEEMVVPVPDPPVVERDEEHVGAVETLESLLRARASGDGVAQPRGQPAQDRGVEQEVPVVLVLAVQDLADEVVDDEAVVAGEARDEVGDVVAALHRERGELQRRDPAFGAILDRVRRPPRRA